MPDWHELAVVMFLVSIDKRSQKHKPHPSPPVFPSQGLGRTWIPEGLYQVVDFTLERINDEDNQYLTEEILVRQRNFPPLGSGPEFDVKFTYPGPVDEGDEREREREICQLWWIHFLVFYIYGCYLQVFENSSTLELKCQKTRSWKLASRASCVTLYENRGFSQCFYVRHNDNARMKMLVICHNYWK